MCVCVYICMHVYIYLNVWMMKFYICTTQKKKVDDVLDQKKKKTKT
jgi:hypothetical protein